MRNVPGFKINTESVRDSDKVSAVTYVDTDRADAVLRKFVGPGVGYGLKRSLGCSIDPSAGEAHPSSLGADVHECPRAPSSQIRKKCVCGVQLREILSTVPTLR